jgi:WD40 repeat protein
MAINFPNNPVVNDTFTVNSIVYTWNGISWRAAATNQVNLSGLDGPAATFVAKDKLKIGDIVYTIDGDIDETPYSPILTNIVRAAVFSPDETKLVLVGEFIGYAKFYNVSGTTITYTSDIYVDENENPFLNTVNAAAFSPDGTKLVLGIQVLGAKLYTVSNTSITFNSNISELDNSVNTVAFSPDGTTLVLGGNFTGRAKRYTVSNNTVTFTSNLFSNAFTGAISGAVNTAVFSPDGNTLVLGGEFTNFAYRYTVSNTTITYTNNIFANAGTTALNSTVRTAVFSPDGTTLVLGGDFTGRAKRYTVSGTTITFTTNIFADASTTALSDFVFTAVFSPDGNTLVLGGQFTGRAKRYTVSGTTITFTTNIFADASTTLLSSGVRGAAFSPNGATLVLGGQFTDRAKRYTVSGTTITFTTNIFASTKTTALNDIVNTAAFSPNGNTLVLGGAFTGFAKVYKVSGNIITYISDIFANTAGTTPLNGSVNTAVFSPNGNTLVLGGAFTGRAKSYTVSGTTITFTSDIFANAGTTALNLNVNQATFSPDGATLVLIGQFTGRAKRYTVSGTTITFTSDIFANAGTTALSSTGFTAAFSPDGTTLVLGGDFTGRAKRYTVSGTTITYTSDIFADAGTTVLNNTVRTAAFSPDGTTLVLGGAFTRSAKRYTVSGTTITFTTNIFDDDNITVNSARFSPDGATLVLGGDFGGSAKLYTVSGSTITFANSIFPTASLIGPIPTNTVAFSPDGSKLVLGGDFKLFANANEVQIKKLVSNGQFLSTAKFYTVSGSTISYIKEAYSINSPSFNVLNNINSYNSKIAFVTSDAEIDQDVSVKILNL